MAEWEMVFLTYAGELERIEMNESDFEREYACQPVTKQCTVWATVYHYNVPHYRVSMIHSLGRGDILMVKL